jgi:hypothetical protein
MGTKDEVMDCKYFDGCSAPLCPRDEGVTDRTWFPDEDICRLADAPEWVKWQRRVSKGMKGIDPDGTDKERAADEAAWFKAHPVMTAEMREKLRIEGEKKKELLHRARLKKMRLNIGPDALPGEKGSWIPLPGTGPENA